MDILRIVSNPFFNWNSVGTIAAHSINKTMKVKTLLNVCNIFINGK